MFYQEYNFSIRTEWNGVPINHAPVTFQIRAQDSRAVLISVSGPFFNDPGPPPSCASGSPCDGLWDYEGKYFLLCDNGRIKLIGRTQANIGGYALISSFVQSSRDMRRAKRGIFVARPGRCTAESSSSKCIILIQPISNSVLNLLYYLYFSC